MQLASFKRLVQLDMVVWKLAGRLKGPRSTLDPHNLIFSLAKQTQHEDSTRI